MKQLTNTENEKSKGAQETCALYFYIAYVESIRRKNTCVES